jgi:hypothetical protein
MSRLIRMDYLTTHPPPIPITGNPMVDWLILGLGFAALVYFVVSCFKPNPHMQ